MHVQSRGFANLTYCLFFPYQSPSLLLKLSISCSRCDHTYSVATYTPHLSHFGQICDFRDPNLVTFYFYELTHFLDQMKNTLRFIFSTNILVPFLTVKMKNCLTPLKSENVRPHSSNSSENANPS